MPQVAWLFVSSVLCGLVGATAWQPVSDLIDRGTTTYTADLSKRAVELGLDMSAFKIAMRWWLLLVVLTFTIMWGVLRMPPVAVLVCVMMIGAPRAFISMLIERKRLRLRDQMVAASRSLVSQLRAGIDIPAALKSVADEIRPPLKHELTPVVKDYFEGGVPLNDGLTKLKERLRIEAVSMFVVSLIACQRKGGDLTRAMESICSSLEQMQRLELKRDSNTAGGRLMVITLALFPLVFGFLFCMIDPNSMSLVGSTFAGQIVICIVIALTYLAVHWAFWLISAID